MNSNNINGQEPSKFLEKIKKQAKQLLKISQNNENNLSIQNLTAAQDVLAKVNGYPSWYALQRTIQDESNEESKTVKPSEQYIVFERKNNK